MNIKDLLLDYKVEILDLNNFVLNALLAALLSWILARYYRRYGLSVSNRSQFANNFMLLALSTMLIIYIVKSSIALSLGLVGALSIVRFRAAIKEPEELTFLFLVIGIGLGMGANQPLITVVAFVLILGLLYLQARMRKSKAHDLHNQMVVNIATSTLDEATVNATMTKHFADVELRRMSLDKGKLFMSYVIEATKFDQLSQTKQQLLTSDPEVEFSFVDNKNMIG